MKLSEQNDDFFTIFDEKYSYKKGDLGVLFVDNDIIIKLWQPLAKNVELLLFNDTCDKHEFLKISMKKDENVWVAIINNKYEGKFYQFLITQDDNKKTFALDPYAYSLGAFDWEGKENKVPKGALVDIKNNKKCGELTYKLKNDLNVSCDPFIYELNIRDYTSLIQDKQSERTGTFLSALKYNIFDHLKSLSVSHVQLLPVHNTYAINEMDTRILNKGDGSGWTTNYNWGYDTMHYFSVNGYYSSDPFDPYKRISEFKMFVNEAHKNNIGVILDVVYNHMMTNTLLDNILPGYYYRDKSKIRPVAYPPLATQRYMVRKLIYESLKHFVEYYGVDGFRFDLSSFIDKETFDYCVKKLREIKPNLIVHGEAWQFTDLEYKDSYVKGITDNKIHFGYFNDSLRSIMTKDEHGQGQGIVDVPNKEKIAQYRSCVVGGLNNYNWNNNIVYSKREYDLFTKYPGNNLSYVACHDGGTLWDRLCVDESNKKAKIETIINKYRMALMAQITTQGRQLILAGTELAHSKPADKTGQDYNKCLKSKTSDFFNLQPDENKYHFNSYKSTDYTNGIKWENLNNKLIKKHVYEFVQDLIKFRQNTQYFRLNTSDEINKYIRFDEENNKENIVDYSIKVDDKKALRVIHNFDKKDIKIIDFNKYNVLFCSRIDNKKSDAIQAQTSYILSEK
ncbi:alpha-amylase family glycosyl hydrolase [Mycoplasma elephantis]|uniref:alpha-amylase family glycosyl hydrolase n=1 Tax=Mycoplasma elephantis TaxID=114882 RepID=UPI000483CB0A|nr:alpha-amylase family glycosyl hydrolase [Mycoplasma elephantis]